MADSASKDKVIYVSDNSDDDSPNIAGKARKDKVVSVDDDIPSTTGKRGKKRAAPSASSRSETAASPPQKSRKIKAAQKNETAVPPPQKSQKKKAGASSSETVVSPPQKSQKKKAGASSSETAEPPPQKSQKKAAKSEEKRDGRLRTITQAIKDRIARALGQRMFLIERKDTSAEGSLGQEFTVLGSTGNVYNVKIDKHPKCDCPDHKKGNLCKHILFVFLKVLKAPRDSYIICQRALLQHELQEVFSRAPKRTGRVLASAAVRAAYAGGSSEEAAGPSTDKRKPIGEEPCSICFDDISDTDDRQGGVVWCEAGCGHNFHQQCMQMWLGSKQEANQKTCPLCRTLWPVPAAGGQHEGEEGYVNLGQLQPGVAAERDTSTYSEWGYNRYRRGCPWF